MATGQVNQFNSVKGYGFIKPDEGGSDVFIHVNEMAAEDVGKLRSGVRVSYDLRSGTKGPKAVRVRVISGAENHPARTMALEPAGKADYLSEGAFRAELDAMYLSFAQEVVDLARRRGWVA